jgi:hypothetical protein
MKAAFTVLATLAFVHSAHADVLSGVLFSRVYSQSRADSTAHLVQISQPLPAPCNLNRLYIDINDKELLASALMHFSMGKSVDIVYQIDAAPRSAAGHIAGLTCRLVSIF